MNKLLSFNPEPFETRADLEGMFQEYEAEGTGHEREGEFEFRRPGGRSGYSRPQAARAQRDYGTATRPKPLLKPTLVQSGFAKPPGFRPKLPFFPPKPPRPRFPVFPFVPYPWPPFPIPGQPEPREPSGAEGLRGEPGAGPPPEQEPSEPPFERVRWAQNCLNQFLGLRLPLDGILNPATRSAVRTFQERRGLPITGLVGPETEQGLAEVCKAASPQPPTPEPSGSEPGDFAQPGESSGAAEAEWESSTVSGLSQRSPSRPGFSSAASPGAGAFPSQPFRQKIVQIANQELARWGNGSIKETDPRVRQVIRDYWITGTGNSYSEAQLGNPVFHKDHPWSAAFISWVMRTAGAGNFFKYASAHAVYTNWAKDNRSANNDNPFKAYRITEFAPQVGDVVCKRRAGSGATYDNIRPGMKTHCDIVTEVQPGRLFAVGGNVNNSVAKKTLPTDAKGFITNPDYFAVIRIGGTGPSSPSVTPPAPTTRGTGSVPRLLKNPESTPPGTTLYVNIDLGIVDKFGITAAPSTGIFIPNGYVSGAAVDLILYLHGHKGEPIRREAIDQYWNSQRFPYGAFREGTNASGRNVVLVAPTLGSRSEAGSLLRPGGLDAYFEQVLAALRAHAPQGRMVATRSLGSLILACHSGGGWPMRQLTGARDQALARIRECWGFDCTYNRGDDAFWAGWAQARPNARVYIYYISGSPTAPLAESLRNMRVSNAIVRPSRDGRHNYVPIAHWQERVQGTNFLAARSGGAIQPGPIPPAPTQSVDVRRMTKAQFLEFVGSNATRAMAKTGVPASVTVAQAILETGWGKHTIGEAKNLFGIKGRGPLGSVRAPTREYLNGKWVTVTADFAKYDSFEQSITEHTQFFLHNRRYARALQVKNNPDAFASEIHKAGYATAPDYADQLIALMRKYNLYRFDQLSSAKPGPTSPGPSMKAGEPDIVAVRGIRVARQIAPQIEALLAAAETDGVRLAGGGFRSRESQIDLRRKHCGSTHYDIYEKPSSQCTPPTARPGASMHEKGLAIDFEYNGRGIANRSNPGFQWLSRNASRFGLYNLQSEPWHWSVNGA